MSDKIEISKERLRQIVQGGFDAGWAACCDHFAHIAETRNLGEKAVTKLRAMAGNPPDLSVCLGDEGETLPGDAEVMHRQSYGQIGASLGISPYPKTKA